MLASSCSCCCSFVTGQNVPGFAPCLLGINPHRTPPPGPADVGFLRWSWVLLQLLALPASVASRPKALTAGQPFQPPTFAATPPGPADAAKTEHGRVSAWMPDVESLLGDAVAGAGCHDVKCLPAHPNAAAVVTGCAYYSNLLQACYARRVFHACSGRLGQLVGWPALPSAAAAATAAVCCPLLRRRGFVPVCRTHADTQAVLHASRARASVKASDMRYSINC